MNPPRPTRSAVLLAAAAAAGLLTTAAFAGTSPPANAGDPAPVTVSISGSTAMRAFTISKDFSALTPGTMILINGMPYVAAAGNSTAVNLAAPDATKADPYTSASTSLANFLAYRIEYHEQGSVEGIAEMTNDQVGPVASVDPTSRNPVNPSANVSGVGNRIYINGTAFTAAGTSSTGFTVNNSNYTSDLAANGTNTAGGQNRVQMAISDVRSLQGFSVAGASVYNNTAGAAGYGKGNPVLQTVSSTNLLGLGSASVRRQLIDQTSLNMSTDKIDPKTGQHYAAGAWNTAGVGNTDNRIVASTASTFAANPGTGLTDVNKSDARWLQATGRLGNGADFNMTTRDVNSGTLNVAASNVGLDPSYAVGENDAGNGLSTTADQTAVGANILFSGKSSGGQLRTTVQNSRMAIGQLSLNDIRSGNAAGTLANANQGAAPLRALGVRNSDDNSAAAVQPSFETISNGSYLLSQNEMYVTIKDPTNGAAAISAYQSSHPGATNAQAWAALTDDQTGAKGDTNVHTQTVTVNGVPMTIQTGDVTSLRNNILNSAGIFPAATGLSNPANGLLTQSFIPTKFMQMTKVGDGVAPTANPNFDAADYGTVKAAFGSQFDVGAASGVTTGTGAKYGTGTNAIAITNNNYLFGDFNGDGKRDFQDLKYAVAGQATLGSSNTNYTSGGNTTVAYNGFTKGDLIVKGDYNSDGVFDGRDLYAFAHGAALADAGKTGASLVANPDGGQLSTASGATVSDQYRAGTLYKNAALDYLQANANATQKMQATANSSNDPSGANAFNKFDTNRDGRVNLQDAAIVDGFVGKDYRVLTDQLSAVVATNVNAAGSVFLGDPTVDQTTPRKAFNLVDAELNDNGAITNTLDASGTSDFKLIRDALGTSLKDGDTNFSGNVNFTDLSTLLNDYGQAGKWSQGDFTFDGQVTFADLSLLLNNYDPNAVDAAPMIVLNGLHLDAAAESLLVADGFNVAVPEPGMAGLAVAGLLALRRRRHAR